MNSPVNEETENQLLVARIGLAAKIVIAGIFAQMIVAWLLHGHDRPSIIGIQAFNALVVALMLGVTRSPSKRTRNLVMMLAGYGVTTVCAAAVGILAADATTSIIVIIACALGTSAFVPWGPRWQSAAALHPSRARPPCEEYPGHGPGGGATYAGVVTVAGRVRRRVPRSCTGHVPGARGIGREEMGRPDDARAHRVGGGALSAPRRQYLDLV
jgi:hypothetical protein